MAYTIFDFDDGTAAGGLPSSVAGPGGALNFVDEAVSFTFSVASGSLAHANPKDTVSPSIGQFSGYGGPGLHTLQMNRTPLVDNFLGATAAPINIHVTSVGGKLTVSFLHSTNTALNVVRKVTGSGAVNLSVTATGEFNRIRFTYSTTYGFDSLGTDFACFLEGTRIATPKGEVLVESLQPGDRLLTAAGRETSVKWVGRQPVPARYLHPAKINPICISAGALAAGVPARDLHVSQDHAIAIDGHLINAGALANGDTIYQVRNMPLDGFTYYHIETDAHDLILAENTPAESFIDYAGRDGFVNGDERDGAAVIHEMDLPRISDARLVPKALFERRSIRLR